jgi:hypothetical protein
MIRTKIFLGVFLFFAVYCIFGCTSVSNNSSNEIVKPGPAIEPTNPYSAVDKSPMDISYYPVNYPMQLMSGNDSSALLARLIYSRPQKNGRVIFGNEAPPKCVQQYGSYWRLGANEATEIEFFKNAQISGQKIAKGRYIIYCIPFENTWTIVFNRNLYSWGLHTDTTKDIAKVEIPVQKNTRPIEFFTMVFQQAPKGAGLLMAWDNVSAVLPITFEK